MSFFTAKIRLWPVVVVPILVVAALIAAFASGLTKALPLGTILGGDTHDRDSQVIQSVERQQEVALVRLAIQGIDRRDANGKIFGVAVPASESTTFVQYEFRAKLGLDGERVSVRAAGDGHYVVTVPDFTFIGYDKPHFEDPVKAGAPLSWMFPNGSETDMINKILDEEHQKQYVDQYTDILEDQTKSYYTGIITSVDPAAKIDFEFAR